jgi:hypothetical protein
MRTIMSGKADMKLRAAAVIAARPTDGGPALMVSEPSSAKNDATCEGSWLHHAAVYRDARALTLARSTDLPPEAQPLLEKSAIAAAMGIATFNGQRNMTS